MWKFSLCPLSDVQFLVAPVVVLGICSSIRRNILQSLLKDISDFIVWFLVANVKSILYVK